MIKFVIPHAEARNVFARLEIMNITGTKLLDQEGRASDVRNSYDYVRKTGIPWDLAIDPPKG
ncbi:hypothetical protein NKH45_35420 [Mesorhizobium sp. M1156]|uniref:hypothetical protein n=1 Tax=Mesorhizobium sp. M1156 TaxID=2957064 RepID=UPI0033389677